MNLYLQFFFSSKLNQSLLYFRFIFWYICKWHFHDHENCENVYLNVSYPTFVLSFIFIFILFHFFFSSYSLIFLFFLSLFYNTIVFVYQQWVQVNSYRMILWKDCIASRIRRSWRPDKNHKIQPKIFLLKKYLAKSLSHDLFLLLWNSNLRFSTQSNQPEKINKNQIKQRILHCFSTIRDQNKKNS